MNNSLELNIFNNNYTNTKKNKLEDIIDNLLLSLFFLRP